MKFWTRIYKWLIVSLSIQLLIMIILETSITNRKLSVTLDKYSFNQPFSFDSGAEIASQASNIKVSYDGDFLCYTNNDNIKIMNLKTKTDYKDFELKKDEISYYRWMTDRNILVYAVKKIDSGGGVIEIHTFDISSKTTKNFPRISRLKTTCFVDDIELSELTNMVYVKIADGNKTARIYSFNIMGNSAYIMTVPIETKIFEAKYFDVLFYSDNSNRVFFRDGSKSRITQLSNVKKGTILGIDKEDKIYVGELDSLGYVEKISIGKLAQDGKWSWSTILLDTKTDQDKIIISEDGHILIHEKLLKKIVDITKNNDITYKGELIDIIKDKIITRDGNHLRLENFISNKS